ncbi:universal stress protein [Pontibacter sp. G13]|uniref:universal stress protein n=1 Tax=Pontibacter sp. G13 TaxID=3074898 RepID=UPI002889BF00|nr:universal stress protein [Pontibacter sp. G13]WNJ17390.1 universal stress protein [Pontibacter sp. G13]
MKKLLLATKNFDPAEELHTYTQAFTREISGQLYRIHAYKKDAPLNTGAKPKIDKIRKGKPLQEIANVAREESVDLIVMGRGTGPRWFSRNSLANKVLNKSLCPVMVVPPEVEFSGIKHIVYATNFSDRIGRIPPQVEGLAQRLNARISSVFIRQQGKDIPSSGAPVLEESRRSELNPGNIFFYTLRHKHVQQGLEWFMEQYPTDLLVIASLRKASVKQPRMTGLAQRIVRETKVPLLAVLEG